MRSMKTAAVVMALWLTALTASAHTMWVMAEKAEPGEDGVVVLGYGHEFPVPEEIPEDRVHIFAAPEVVAPDGERIAVEPTGDSYRFTTVKPLAEGTYLLLAEYQPTFWTQTRSGGYQMLPKTEVTGTVVNSYRYAVSAKAVVNVGGAASDEDAGRVVGSTLEIVPQVNPASVGVGETMRVRVLYRGEPLANAWVYGLTEGYAPGLHDAKAFANRTDRNGYVDFVPWKSGYWQLEAEKRVDLEETATHDYEEWCAKLCFIIN